MKDLIERLENATGPDAGLDLDISQLINTYSAPDRGDPHGTWPHYTGSVDAARTIGNGYLCVSASDIGADGLAFVKLVKDTSTDPIIEYTGIHSLLQIAWCIAALKAYNDPT